MPSYVCVECEIHYPAGASYLKCPVHGTAVKWAGRDPDPDWKERRDEILAEMKTATDPELDDLIPYIEGSIRRVGGHVLLSMWDAYWSGPRREIYRTGDLLRLRGKVYEIIGRAPERREYVLREFQTTLDLPVTNDVPDNRWPPPPADAD